MSPPHIYSDNEPTKYSIFLAMLDEDVEIRKAASVDYPELFSSKGVSISSDNPSAPRHTKPMNTSSHTLTSDALTAMESRMDARFDRLSEESIRRLEDHRRENRDGLDAFRREMELRDMAFKREQEIRDKALDQRFQDFLTLQSERDKRADERFYRIENDMSEIKADFKSGFSSLRNTAITTAIGASLTIIMGVAAFNSTLTSNMISALQLGINSQSQAAQQSNAQPSITPSNSSQPMAIPAQLPATQTEPEQPKPPLPATPEQPRSPLTATDSPHGSPES